MIERVGRVEHDSLGEVRVPADALWGAQTQRAVENFPISGQRLPRELLRALALLKAAVARAGAGLGTLEPDLARAIAEAADEVARGDHDAHFPVDVYQTGSGTSTNMNANEVIANRANEMLGQPLGTRAPVHPNDHVNRGQSSNDSFPTVMHLAAVRAARARLLPGLAALHAALTAKAAEYRDIVKLGRTHMMDAVPVTLGGEFATWARQVENGIARVADSLPRLLLLPQGGTAAGTGLNRHPDFDDAFCAILAARTGEAFAPNPDKSEGMSAHDAFVELHGAMNTVAVSLTKIANDIRLLGSGPRGGIGELVVPADGLSSSIMPGKTNPTQAEALTMVCARVMGNQTTVTIAGAQGHLELNVFKPVIIQSVLESAHLLGDASASFAAHMVAKLEPNRARIADQVAKSLMLVTALNPHIGYDKAVQIAKLALAEDLTLKDAATRLGHVSAEEFDRWVRPEEMLRPGGAREGGG